MLFRVRKIVNKDIVILVDNLCTLNNNPFEPFEELKEILYNKDYVIGAFEYIKLWNKWESNNNKNFLNVFKYYTNLKGFSFNIEKKPEKIAETQTNSLENIKKILNSDLVNYETFCLLSEKVKRLEATTEDKYKIEKYIYFSKFKLDKNFNDEKIFKKRYHKKLHILKGYLYNKFHNNKNIEENERIINNICKNINKNSENEKAKESNNKYKNFYEINKNIKSLDEKYYNNKFDKKIIETKYKYFLQLEKILKEKDNKIKKNILTDKKDELINIFNCKEFKLVFEQRAIKEATNKKILSLINSVYGMFGLEIKNVQETTNNEDNKRNEHLETKLMDCIPKCYIDYEEYIKKYKNNDEEYMKYFKQLVKEKKEKKKKDLTIEDFIIDFS